MSWDVAGKTILLTGATSGIGLTASIELARRGANIVVVGRNPEKTRAAVAAVSAGARGTVAHLLCDFSSQAAIRKLADDYRAGHDRLDVLVNNAGAANNTRRLSEDGIELTFAVNHLGYFLLTNLLLDLLKKSAPSRIVTVSSIAHRRGTMNLEDIGFERSGYSILRAYSRSKLANVLFAAELSRRLKGTGVTSNSVHPGTVNTNIWSGAPVYAKLVVNLILKRFFISAEKGGDTIVQLAADPALDGVTGKYFENKRPVMPAAVAQDENLARRLWDVSAQLVRLNTERSY
jgi:NAD(P)-dependent dehydrogenase (short-subunit alcohol dehydrogenase family)